MSIIIYNTLKAKKEEFHPLNNNTVNMYVCGVTPYGPAHLGHARCYVTFDTVRRYLEYKGYEVKYIQNITDIDDKIIKQSQQESVPWKDVSEKYWQDYIAVMDKLNIKDMDCYSSVVSRYPRATEYIEEMQKIIQALIEKGFAYAVDGSVYFSVRKSNGYGQLSHRDFEGMRSGVRIKIEEAKQDPLDFVLWKKAKEGEPSWPSPWGSGRPGWHIECSTMSLKLLGETLDIHGGGADLIFPHHENEIAQSEAYTGKEFVRYWMHNGFVTINKEKMSKSLGNVFNLKDIFEKYQNLFEIHNKSQISQIVRLFLLSQHYRSPIDFSGDRLEQAKKNWEIICFTLEDIEYDKYMNAIEKGDNLEKNSIEHLKNDKEIDRFVVDFKQVMDDDFNTARALAIIYNFISLINSRVGFNQYLSWLKLAQEKMIELLDNVLGLKYEHSGFQKKLDSAKIIKYKRDREQARKNKDWPESDRIRSELEKMGFMVEDTPQGTRLRRKG